MVSEQNIAEQHFLYIFSNKDISTLCCILFFLAWFGSVDQLNKCIRCQEGVTHWNPSLKTCVDECCCGMENHKETGVCKCPDGLHLIGGTCGACSEKEGEMTKLVFVTKEDGESDDINPEGTAPTATAATAGDEAETDSREATCVCADDYNTVPVTDTNPVATCLKCPPKEFPAHTLFNHILFECEPVCKHGQIYDVPKDQPLGSPKICRCPDETPVLIDMTCSAHCPSKEELLPVGGNHICKDSVGVDPGGVSNEKPFKECSNKAMEMALVDGTKGFSITKKSDGAFECALCKNYLLETDARVGVVSETWYLGPYASWLATTDIVQRTTFEKTDHNTGDGMCTCPPEAPEWSPLVQSCIKCPDDKPLFNEQEELCYAKCDESEGKEWDFGVRKCVCPPNDPEMHVIGGICTTCEQADGVQTKFLLENAEENIGSCACEIGEYWAPKVTVKEGEGEVKDNPEEKEDGIALPDAIPPKCVKCDPPQDQLNEETGVCEEACSHGKTIAKPEKCPGKCLCPADTPFLIIDAQTKEPKCVECPGNTIWSPSAGEQPLNDPINENLNAAALFLEIKAFLNGKDDDDTYILSYPVHIADPCREIVGACNCPTALPFLTDAIAGTCINCKANELWDKYELKCEPSCPYDGQIPDPITKDCKCPGNEHVLGEVGDERCGLCSGELERFHPHDSKHPDGPGKCECPLNKEHRVVTQVISGKKDEKGGDVMMDVITCISCNEPGQEFDALEQQCKKDCPGAQIYIFPNGENPQGRCECPKSDPETPHYVLGNGGEPTCVLCGSTEEDRGRTNFVEGKDKQTGVGECECPPEKPFWGKIKGGKYACVACEEEGYEWHAKFAVCGERCSHGKEFQCVPHVSTTSSVPTSSGTGMNPVAKSRTQCNEGQPVLDLTKPGQPQDVKGVVVEDICGNIEGCTWHGDSMSCLPMEEEPPFEQICTCVCPAAEPDMLPKTENSDVYQCGACNKDVRTEANILDPDDDLVSTDRET